MWNKYRRYPVPTNGKRGCLCKDTNTYSRKCCDGSLWAQGIGRIYDISTFLLLEDGDFLLQESNDKIKL